MDIKIINNIRPSKKTNPKESQNLPKFDINKTVDELKKELIKYFELKISQDRLGLSYFIEEGKERIQMSELLTKVKDLPNFTTKSIIVMKDLGPQISYRLTYNLEYIGPIFIMTYFYLKLQFEAFSITAGQKMLYYGTLIHFLRRIFESNCVHIFSRRTMPLKNLFKNCAYYWILFGYSCGYFILKPNYEDIIRNPKVKIGIFLFYFNTEIKNFQCHMTLRDIKIFNRGQKDIPRGGFFNLATCANYTWEFFGWVLLCFIAFHWSIVLFTIVGFLQMRAWAIKKHNYLKKTFPNYPKSRKAFIPLII